MMVFKGLRGFALPAVLSVMALSMLAGRAAHADTAVVLTAPFTSVGSDSAETSIGELAADALRHAGGAQVGLVDAGSLQPISLPRGPTKASQFRGALTVGSDPVVILTIPGSVLTAALERGVSSYPQSSPGFLQISGITFTLHGSAGNGARVANVLIGGSPLVRNASYTVAMPQSLAQGANGYFLVWPASAQSRIAGAKEGDAITSFVSGQSSLSPAGHRISGQ